MPTAATATSIQAPRTAIASPLRQLATFSAIGMAGLSAAAGGIHGGALPEHAREHWAFAVFFAGSAAFQIGWAILAARRLTPPLLRLAVGANAAFIGLWFVTRTTGIPIGPEHWTPEPVGFADAVTVAFEAAIVVIALRLLRPGALESLSGRLTPRWMLGLAAGVAVVALAALAAVGRAEEAEMMGSETAHARHVLVGADAAVLVYCGALIRRARAHGPSSDSLPR
ncbi:MAG: hypothetical protein LC722_01015 [Actinobacteria bacterium]|nr:hypothetical protein [Actinomycetota bacterium]